MKLLHRTYIQTSLWLIPVMVTGAVFVYFMITYISYGETDEFLTYEMERLINYHKKNNDLPDFHMVSEIIPGVKLEQPVFKDTLKLETGDNELVPYRELAFSLEHNGEDFTLVIRQLLPGRDDIARGTLMIIVGLMILIYLMIFGVIKRVANKTWKPFYKTLKLLSVFNPEKKLPEFPITDVDEFKTLNHSLHALLNKTTEDYRNIKEFNENVSHELQTHLAVIRTGLENLLDKVSKEKKDAWIEDISKMYTSANQLIHAQKSLSLLSRIGNREFNKKEELNLKNYVENSIEIYTEAMELRKIFLQQDLMDCVMELDSGLTEILINNLIKNAVKHNIQNGIVRIHLDKTSLKIENSGPSLTLKPEKMTNRYEKGKTGNTGIGLAIVKQICDLYKFQLQFSKSDPNLYRVEIFFSGS